MPGYEITQFHYSGGKGHIPTATVEIRKPDGSKITDAATEGNGPVDATSKAIKRILGMMDLNLTDFRVDPVNTGFDASGKVIVRLEYEGKEYEGSAKDTDIIVASAEAFMNALNQYASFEATVAAHIV